MYMKRFGSRLTTISLLALLPMATGCGFVFSHAPPEGHEQMDFFTCTESVVLPSEGTTGLSSSAGGEPHIFAWDSAANIPSDAPTVWLKVHPMDS